MPKSVQIQWVTTPVFCPTPTLFAQTVRPSASDCEFRQHITRRQSQRRSEKRYIEGNWRSDLIGEALRDSAITKFNLFVAQYLVEYLVTTTCRWSKSECLAVKSCGGVVAVRLVLFCLLTFSKVCGGTAKLLKYYELQQNRSLDMVGATGSIPAPPTMI